MEDDEEEGGADPMDLVFGVGLGTSVGLHEVLRRCDMFVASQ